MNWLNVDIIACKTNIQRSLEETGFSPNCGYQCSLIRIEPSLARFYNEVACYIICRAESDVDSWLVPCTTLHDTVQV